MTTECWKQQRALLRPPAVLEWGAPIKRKVFVVLLLIAAGVSYYMLVYRPRHRIVGEVAYVLPSSVAIVDTPAEIRLVVDTLKAGDRVEVLMRTRNWMHVRVPDGRTGWVEIRNMLDAETYERGRQLVKELSTLPPQAAGHLTALANLHLEPARESPLLGQLDDEQKVGIYARRLVPRPPLPDQPARNDSLRDAWYLVLASPRAGWLLGRLVDLDVPQNLSVYAQGTNLVAWLVLNEVSDEGRKVPQYVVADRLGAPDSDFNHIRAFTWWKKRHVYVTAYVEGNLNGYFPLRVMQVGGTPYFRLRLMDARGHKYQKVYGMFDTIVRSVGVVDGWESEAMPERAAVGRKRVPKERRRVGSRG